MRPLALCSLGALFLLGCSGEDEGPGGKGSGVGSGAKGGAAGSSALNVGGQSGRAGASGAAGAGGLAGTSGSAGVAGQGGASGSAGASGGAGAGGLRPSTAVCGNGILEPGERCDGTQGTINDIGCAELLGDPKATGTPSCDRCFPSFTTCVSCKNGKQDGDETDIDCGAKAGCGPCALGDVCKTTADCDAPSACIGGVCTDAVVTYGARLPFVPPGDRIAIPIIVESTPQLSASTAVQFVDSSAGSSLDPQFGGDVFRLVARVTPGSFPSSTLQVGGHAFDLLGIVATNPLTGSAGPSIKLVTGRLGNCASVPPAEMALVLEAKPTGASPALELPIGRPICLHVELAQKALGTPGFTLSGSPKVATQRLSDEIFELDVTMPSTPLFVGASGNTPVQLFMSADSGSSLATQPLVISPFTSQVGATGVGTTSSPAAPPSDLAAIGAPFTDRTVWQIRGPHTIPASGLSIPDNLEVRGLDATASFVRVTPGPGLVLGTNSRLRDLDVDGGSPGGTGGSADCVTVAGKSALLSRVRLRRCNTGLRLQDKASARFVGQKQDDVTEIIRGFVGGTEASLTVENTSIVGGSDQGQDGVRDFPGGSVTLRRVTTDGIATALRLGPSAQGKLDASTLRFRDTGAMLGTGARLVTRGSTLLAEGSAASQGIGVADKASLEAHGLRVVDVKTSALSIAGGTADLTASVFDHAGGENTATAYLASGGTLSAHGLLIAKPGQIGIFAQKDAAALSIVGAVIEETTFRGIWVYGGTADLRMVKIIDPQRDGLAYGDPCGTVTTSDLDIVKKLPNEITSTLVFADRNQTPSDQISLHTLVAGAGEILRSEPGKPVCGKYFDDPVGGRYIGVNGQSVPVCF